MIYIPLQIFVQKKCRKYLQIPEKAVPLHPLIKTAGCSSARLEYASGGRVVAGSNPVTPTGWKGIGNLMIIDAFFSLCSRIN